MVEYELTIYIYILGEVSEMANFISELFLERMKSIWVDLSFSEYYLYR
jgi:hypothetical protein